MPTSLLDPRVLIALAVSAVLAFAGWKLYQAGGDAVRVEWHKERAKLEAQVDAQAERNRELQRAAEKRYVVQAEAREKYIVETIVEVRRETEILAVCPVPEPARRLLNDAARCARGDTPAACGADKPVRQPA